MIDLQDDRNSPIYLISMKSYALKVIYIFFNIKLLEQKINIIELPLFLMLY